MKRLEFQKVFLKAFIESVIDKPIRLSNIDFNESDDIITNVDRNEAFRIFFQNIMKIKKSDCIIKTLPGESFEHGKVWYYKVNSELASAMIRDIFSANNAHFDSSEIFKFTL